MRKLYMVVKKMPSSINILSNGSIEFVRVPVEYFSSKIMADEFAHYAKDEVVIEMPY